MQPAIRAVFGISTVARLVGVPAATIRTWEDRYRLVVPDRTASGRRLYRRDQVEQLRFVRSRMAEGLSAADAHRVLAERLDQGPLPPAEPVDLLDPGPDRADHEFAVADRPAPRPPAAILLAEFDRYAAEIQEQFLTAEGFEVEIALSEAEARRALAGRRPAVAVIEPLISGGSGLELCRAFKRSGVPVIVASVLQARERALAAGADAFLSKPLMPERLLSAIQDLLAQSPYSPPRAEAVL
ncbi:MAG TPA: MerR family transcriptional regulator [Streptosporangiaceae bacterium]|nr:MerR family transcriptional regulator [Streptosporangiaceae bacterium]